MLQFVSKLFREEAINEWETACETLPNCFMCKIVQLHMQSLVWKLPSERSVSYTSIRNYSVSKIKLQCFITISADLNNICRK